MTQSNLPVAFYEIDQLNKTIVFRDTGYWGAFIRAGYRYSFQDIDHIFKTFILEPHTDPIQYSASNGSSSGIDVKEACYLLPQQKEYQWFSEVLLPPENGVRHGIIRNIHNEKTLSPNLRYCVEHDALTGLLNRNTFVSKASPLLSYGQPGYFVLINADDFKTINDAQGLPYGDEALFMIGRTIKDRLPDGALAARYGGDEFVLYCPQVSNLEEIELQVQQIIVALRSLEFFGRTITVSVGIALFPKHGDTFYDLLHHANTALACAKRDGKNRYALYSPTMDAPKEKDPISSRFIQLPSFQWYHGLLAFLLGLCILSGTILVGNHYLKTLQEVMNAESYTYLNEISAQLSMNVVNAIDHSQTCVMSMRDIVSELEWENVEQMQTWLRRRLKNHNFSAIYLLDSQGRWYTMGAFVKSSELESFTASIVQSKLTRLAPADNYMLLGVPIDVTTKDGVSVCGMVAAIEANTLRNQLSLNIFNGQGFTHIITPDGQILLRSDNSSARPKTTNMADLLGNAQFLDGGSFQRLQETLVKRETIQCHYIVDGEERLAAVVPIPVENWYLVSVLPTEHIHSKANLFAHLTMVACLIIGIVLSLLVLIIVFLQRKGRRQLIMAAYIDPVTEGHTRLRFSQLVKAKLEGAKRPSAIIYANIVEFKAFNDQLGREGADQLLRHVYRVIASTLSGDEYVCRLMADHFGVFLMEDNVEEIEKRAIIWNNQIQEYAQSNNTLTNVKLTYGIYFIDNLHTDILQMLDRANLARQSIQNRDSAPVLYRVYDEALQAKLLYSKELVDRMEYALENGEFILYLQPKYPPDGSRIAGAEALVRWRHPSRGIIPPVDFIPLLESNGTIQKLDLYMFRRTCKWIQSLIDAGIPPIPVSVNLSRSHFRKKDFWDSFQSIWKEYGFDPSLIEFEFTESMFEGQIAEFAAVIEQIHSNGFRCSMDDFGSGYSSLTMISQLHMDAIKLDRQFFLAATETNPQAKATIEAVIGLIKTLNMQAVAEGVEHLEQVEMLRHCGCDLIQGFVFSKPVPMEQLRESLKHYPAALR